MHGPGVTTSGSLPMSPVLVRNSMPLLSPSSSLLNATALTISRERNTRNEPCLNPVAPIRGVIAASPIKGKRWRLSSQIKYRTTREDGDSPVLVNSQISNTALNSHDRPNARHQRSTSSATERVSAHDGNTLNPRSSSTGPAFDARDAHVIRFHVCRTRVIRRTGPRWRYLQIRYRPERYATSFRFHPPFFFIRSDWTCPRNQLGRPDGPMTDVGPLYSIRLNPTRHQTGDTAFRVGPTVRVRSMMEPSSLTPEHRII